MATRDSLVFASKIFDYLESRTQELADKRNDNILKGETNTVEYWKNDGAFDEIINLLDWLYKH